MPDLVVEGQGQLRAVGASLRRAGSPGRGIRAKLRRNLGVAALPVKVRVQANVLAAPSSASGTGLRADVAQAVKITARTAGKNPVVRVWVNPAAMHTHPGSLAGLMEGLAPWRHPVYGHNVWVSQASHPYMAPAEPVAAVAATKAAIAAINETAAEIDGGL